MMRRIAYCSPVNPVATGISDYSEELLPYLGQYADVTLFVEHGMEPTNPQLRQHLAVHSLDQLPALHRRHSFDGIVYHIGNSPAHAAIYDTLQRIPGVVVLHEWMLHHFMLWYAVERRKDVGGYLNAMRQRYGAEGERVARRMSRGQLLDAAFRFPLVEEVIGYANGLIGHSHYVVKQAKLLRPTLPTAVVPMGVPLPRHIPIPQARMELGLPLDVPIWASFGHINPYKRMESALRAFRRFRAEQTTARYILVGSVSPSYDLHALVRRLGLADAVDVTGYMPRADFERFVAAADLCLNLRAPTAGETSASLLRLLGAGRPTLVSAIDAFAELPDDVCAKVDVDASEEALILAYARLLHSQPALAAHLGENARQFVAREHTLERAAQSYIDFLSSVYGWGPIPKIREPLWSIKAAEVERITASGGESLSVQQVSRIDAHLRQQPSATTAEADALIAGVGQAMAELGVTEHDQQPITDISATIADLLDTEQP